MKALRFFFGENQKDGYPLGCLYIKYRIFVYGIVFFGIIFGIALDIGLSIVVNKLPITDPEKMFFMQSVPRFISAFLGESLAVILVALCLVAGLLAVTYIISCFSNKLWSLSKDELFDLILFLRGPERFVDNTRYVMSLNKKQAKSIIQNILITVPFVILLMVVMRLFLHLRW